jgi:hypothetical protein
LDEGERRAPPSRISELRLDLGPERCEGARADDRLDPRGQRRGELERKSQVWVAGRQDQHMGVQRRLDAQVDEVVTQRAAGIEVATAHSEGVEDQADQALGGRRRG